MLVFLNFSLIIPQFSFEGLYEFLALAELTNISIFLFSIHIAFKFKAKKLILFL
jgi:hypothetical protein